MRWETGLLSMRLRIWAEKLILVRHLRSLETSTLARQLYEEQKAKGLPGLARETAAICQQLGMEDCNEVDMGRWSNKQYRTVVLDFCKTKDEEELRMMAQGQKKVQRRREEEGPAYFFGKKLPKIAKTVAVPG